MNCFNDFLAKHIISILEIPTVSRHESEMINYIKEWAALNNISCHKDRHNNLYLSKGIINKTEYYPCITAHLDTAQNKHTKYVKNKEKLPLNFDKYENKNRIFCENFGVGGDNKCGISIALFLLLKIEKLKFVLFSNEEIGLKGSKNLDINFFKDIGYVISFDSPSSNNIVYACRHTILFSKSFYNKIKNICNKYNYINLCDDMSLTDIVNIKEITNIECLLLSSGFYLPHSKYEFVLLDDMKNAVNLGVSLIENIGYNKYIFNATKLIKQSDNHYTDEIYNNIKLLLTEIKK